MTLIFFEGKVSGHACMHAIIDWFRVRGSNEILKQADNNPNNKNDKCSAVDNYSLIVFIDKVPIS